MTMFEEYTIERGEHGILVRGSIPISEFVSLAEAWAQQGWTLMAPGIAQACGANFAITNEEHRGPWLEQVHAVVAKRADGDRELEWLLGTDTGTSSLTIFSVLSREHAFKARPRLGSSGPCPPQDPDDFGRCYRLLERFPTWKYGLAQVAAKYPEWTGLVRGWDELCKLWNEESPSGNCPKLYDRMRDMLDER
jgi:hypothetical protein